MSLVKQVKRVSSHLTDRLRKLRKPRADESVEAQADALRIWMWSSAAALALIVVFTVASNSASRAPETSREAAPNVTEQMPTGFLLVPIEPANLEALDSMFGQHGFVDLYRADGGARRGKRVARGVALIRSPRNPRRFAVLMPESDSDRMPELADPVLVIMRKGPASAGGPKLVAKSPKTAIRKVDLIEEAQPELIELNETGDRYEN